MGIAIRSNTENRIQLFYNTENSSQLPKGYTKCHKKSYTFKNQTNFNIYYILKTKLFKYVHTWFYFKLCTHTLVRFQIGSQFKWDYNKMLFLCSVKSGEQNNIEIKLILIMQAFLLFLWFKVCKSLNLIQAKCFGFSFTPMECGHVWINHGVFGVFKMQNLYMLLLLV